jgi:UDPglucose 6-dehydrogenase/GDP-mannose 6-dehydrogenase
MKHRVTCVDVLHDKVDAINRGEAPLYEPGLTDLIREGRANGLLAATGDLGKALEGSRISIIAVGTPLVEGDMDLGCVADAAAGIGKAIGRAADYHTVVVKSTVTPGATQTLIREKLEESSGKSAGEFGLCMNPEFLRQGSAVSDFMAPDRIIIGEWDERSGRELAGLYQGFKCPKIHTSLCNAELIKYASNSLLAAMISFSNEFAAICEAIPDADADVVMKGLSLDRRLSPLLKGERLSPGIIDYLRSGVGFGGSCLPKDVNALRAFARKLKIATPILDSVMQINEARPEAAVAMLERSLGSLEGRTIAVLGLAFKPGTDDLRESPALKIIDRLLDKGAVVRAYDPVAGRMAGTILKDRAEVCPEYRVALKEADAAVIATAWPQFSRWSWPELCGLMRTKVIFDGRGALRHVKWPDDVRYMTIGVAPSEE